MSFFIFIIRFWGFRIQIPLEDVVSFGQMKKHVGLALGRLVDCEVNMLTLFVTFDPQCSCHLK